MKKLLFAFLTLSFLNASCFDLMNFKKHELSGVNGQRAKIIVAPGTKGLKDDLSNTLIQKD